MSVRIKTIGDLRKHLAKTLSELDAGGITPEAANAVSRLSSQINDTFHVEARFAQMQIDRGEAPGALGSLPINGEPTSAQTR